MKMTRPQIGPGSAYVLLKLNVVRASGMKRVLRELRALEAVSGAELVFGPWDVFVEIQFSQEKRLEDTVLFKIRGLRGVTDSMTMLVCQL